MQHMQKIKKLIFIIKENKTKYKIDNKACILIELKI